MMTKSVVAAAAMLGVLTSVTCAQSAVQTVVDTQREPPRISHPYLAKFGDGEEEAGDWRDGARMQRYAQKHEGRYILFLSQGALYRLDSPDQLRTVEPLYTSIASLGKQQAALGAVQRPLGEQQRSLGAVQRGTTDPATQGRIGRAQGDVGRVQGEIGRQQGELGRQQGLLNTAFYLHVQRIIDACLKDKSCAVVETERPA